MSFTESLRELRMQKAIKLLAGTSRPIGKIASLVGYNDASRFAQHFRQRHGVTPSDYRKRHAHDHNLT